MARTDAVALPPDTPAALRLAAEAVGLELGRVTSHFEALPPGHPHAAYADFARLYRSVTCRWLAHLAQQPEKLLPLVSASGAAA